MKLFCIADKESILGFRFAGVEARQAGNRDEALEGLKYAMALEGIGIILVTASVAQTIRQEIDKLTFQQAMPLILEIPSRGVPVGKKGLGEYIQNAIGVSV